MPSATPSFTTHCPLRRLAVRYHVYVDTCLSTPISSHASTDSTFLHSQSHSNSELLFLSPPMDFQLDGRWSVPWNITPPTHTHTTLSSESCILHAYVNVSRHLPPCCLASSHSLRRSMPRIHQSPAAVLCSPSFLLIAILMT